MQEGWASHSHANTIFGPRAFQSPNSTVNHFRRVVGGRAAGEELRRRSSENEIDVCPEIFLHHREEIRDFAYCERAREATIFFSFLFGCPAWAECARFSIERLSQSLKRDFFSLSHTHTHSLIMWGEGCEMSWDRWRRRRDCLSSDPGDERNGEKLAVLLCRFNSRILQAKVIKL